MKPQGDIKAGTHDAEDVGAFGIEATDLWGTPPKEIEALGPRDFGFDVGYTSMEKKAFPYQPLKTSSR